MRRWHAILWGGLAAGILDLTFAITYSSLRGSTPLRLLHSVASGVLGAAAFDGGRGAAALGVLLHFTIAFGACTVFFLASRRLPLLVARPVVCGALCGIAVYFFMQLVVLPLSAVPWTPTFTVRGIVSGFAAHVLCVGLPIALLVRRFGGSPESRSRAREASRAAAGAGSAG